MGATSYRVAETERHLLLESLSAATLLILIGDVSDPLDDTHLFFQKQLLAAQGSMLATVETAYLKINPVDIDSSLQVLQVGKITLRGTELMRRRELYDYFREQMAVLLDTYLEEDNGTQGRIGYTAN